MNPLPLPIQIANNSVGASGGNGSLPVWAWVVLGIVGAIVAYLVVMISRD